MPLPIELKPVETLLFRSDLVALGTFRCPATHPLFRDSGPCTHHTIVFPRTSTVIRHSGGRPFTASPQCATLYNQHQEYTRQAISAEDACDWIVIADDILLEMTGSSRPFSTTHVPIDSRTYLRQRRLFAAPGDEEALMIAARVVAPAPQKPVSRSMRDKVEAVKAAISASPAAHFALRDFARETQSSPFHLCRAFRAVTGSSITNYQHGLRLRLSLELLRDSRAGLADIALQLGFASHSHFTSLFRRHFGIAPSRFRAIA